MRELAAEKTRANTLARELQAEKERSAQLERDLVALQEVCSRSIPSVGKLLSPATRLAYCH